MKFCYSEKHFTREQLREMAEKYIKEYAHLNLKLRYGPHYEENPGYYYWDCHNKYFYGYLSFSRNGEVDWVVTHAANGDVIAPSTCD